MVNVGLLGMTPVALVSPPPVSAVVDMALAVVFPLHGRTFELLRCDAPADIGMNYVITDYVPKFFGKAARGPARVIMFGITALTTAGLVKLNVQGPGITGSLKQLWTK